MHVTFNDVAVFLTEEEWRSLSRGQLQLYMEVMNENYASLQSLGLPVPDSDLLRGTERQKWKKRPFGEAGEQSYAPLRTGKTPNGLIETISMTSGSTESEVNDCRPSDPNQKVLELNGKKNHLASFRKEMLLDSSLQPICLACNGILKCYCDILKQKIKKPYVCEDCGKGYHLQMYLLLHQKSHFREHFYKCTLCDKSFEKSVVLKKHMKTHLDLTSIHPDSGQIATGTPLGNRRKAVRTPPSAQQAALHSCEQCQAVFRSKNLLRIHRRDHKKVKKHSCLICGQIVQTYGQLDIHLKGHRKPYECTVCEKISTSRPDFIAHQREHSGEQMYKCKVCKKAYSRLPGFIKHMTAHLSQATHINNAKPEQPPLPAENWQELRGTMQNVFCGLSQKEERDEIPLNVCHATLKVNVDAAKEREQTFGALNACPVEFKRFKKGKRKLCKKCNKGFRYRESLRRHRDSHRVRFACYQCGRAFCKLVKLYLHRHDHQTCRPFMCKHCTKTFSFRSLLLLHLNTHDPSETGSRYPCAYCRKVFRSQANCVLHHKTHVYKAAKSPTDSDVASFSNIQIAPFSDHTSVEKKPLQEAPPSKVYVQRLCYRPC